ncbi:hypothetical protein Tco_0929363 [Tanacetum coccineum]
MSPRSPDLPLKQTKHIKPLMVEANGGCGSGEDDIIGKSCSNGECGNGGAVIDEERVTELNVLIFIMRASY